MVGLVLCWKGGSMARPRFFFEPVWLGRFPVSVAMLAVSAQGCHQAGRHVRSGQHGTAVLAGKGVGSRAAGEGGQVGSAHRAGDCGAVDEMGLSGLDPSPALEVAYIADRDIIERVAPIVATDLVEEIEQVDRRVEVMGGAVLDNGLRRPVRITGWVHDAYRAACSGGLRAGRVHGLARSR